MAICIHCGHKDVNFPNCSNPDLPITDFVYGKRDCDELNPKGDCKGYKGMGHRESIYESKEDEDLANTS